MNRLKSPKLLVGIALVLIGANILYLDYHTFVKSNSKQPVQTIKKGSQTGFETQLTPLIQAGDIESIFALLNDQIKEATASLTQDLADLSQKVETPVASPGSPALAKTSVKEYYIPLGTGKTTSTSFTDLQGVEAYVVPSNYGKITSLYFEASLRIPTGNGQATARLLNVTDTVPLFESEVSYEGTTGRLISSGSIPVPTITKLYRVQLKSSLGAEVVLDQGRIKIFVE